VICTGVLTDWLSSAAKMLAVPGFDPAWKMLVAFGEAVATGLAIVPKVAERPIGTPAGKLFPAGVAPAEF